LYVTTKKYPKTFIVPGFAGFINYRNIIPVDNDTAGGCVTNLCFKMFKNMRKQKACYQPLLSFAGNKERGLYYKCFCNF